MNNEQISIIIPVFNEAEIIEKTLVKLVNNSGVELIVIDGGSSDRTVELVKKMGIQVVSSSKQGRANQMNFGASIANGEILIFLHADTQLPEKYPEIVKKILFENRAIAGAFKLKIDGTEKSLKLIEKMVNWRSRFLSLPYGDQAIFISKKTFEELDGFLDLPIMEDFEFMQRLKHLGKIEIASSAVTTSDRRWQKLGVWKTTLINQLIILGYYLKISPDRLRRLYNM